MTQLARCWWEVTAGLIPGQPNPEHTRRWVVTQAEHVKAEAGDPEARERYLDAQGAAMNYALWLTNPAKLNWVRLEWVWL